MVPNIYIPKLNERYSSVSQQLVSTLLNRFLGVPHTVTVSRYTGCPRNLQSQLNGHVYRNPLNKPKLTVFTHHCQQGSNSQVTDPKLIDRSTGVSQIVTHPKLLTGIQVSPK